MEKIIKARKGEFWGQERFHDISFSFPEFDPNKILHANKMILALCSPVFEAMFYGDLAEKRNPIPIVDVDPVIFETFLRYIYTEKFQPKSFDEAQNLFYVAHKYEVMSIESACECYMIENLNKFDVNELIAFADMFSMKNLIEICRVHMNHHPRPDLAATWIKYKKGDPLPTGTAFIGTDPTNHWPIGVGRFNFSGDLLPGTFYIKDKYVMAAYGGQAHTSGDEFEILCNGDLEWIPTEKGKIVEKAIVGGRCNYNEELFVGKVERDGKPYVGKVHPSHNCLYIPYLTAELRVPDRYLMLTDKHEKSERQRKPYFDYHPYEDDNADDDDDNDDGGPRAVPRRVPIVRRIFPNNLFRPLNLSNSSRQD